MTPSQCPKCGADVKVAPHATSYQCPYCKNTLELAPPPSATPPAEIPRIIVVHHDTSGAAFVNNSYWGIRLAVFIVLVVLSTGGWGFRRWRGARMANLASLSGWDGTSPLMCGGNDSLDVQGVSASFTAGSAIVASGNCHVTCRDCTLRAPVAVRADGNGQVTLVNGTAIGTETSLTASGNGTINVEGNARVVGPTKQSGNGTVNGVTPSTLAAATAQHNPVTAAPVAPPHAVMPPQHMMLPPPPTPSPVVRRR